VANRGLVWFRGKAANVVRRNLTVRRLIAIAVTVAAITALGALGVSLWLTFSVRERVNETRRDVTSLQSDIADLGSGLDSLSSQVDDVSSQVDDLATANGGGSSSVDDLQASVDQLSSDVQDVGSRLDTLEGSVDGICIELNAIC